MDIEAEGHPPYNPNVKVKLKPKLKIAEQLLEFAKNLQQRFRKCGRFFELISQLSEDYNSASFRPKCRTFTIFVEKEEIAQGLDANKFLGRQLF